MDFEFAGHAGFAGLRILCGEDRGGEEGMDHGWKCTWGVQTSRKGTYFFLDLSENIHQLANMVADHDNHGVASLGAILERRTEYEKIPCTFVRGFDGIAELCCDCCARQCE